LQDIRPGTIFQQWEVSPEGSSQAGLGGFIVLPPCAGLGTTEAAALTGVALGFLSDIPENPPTSRNLLFSWTFFR